MLKNWKKSYCFCRIKKTVAWRILFGLKSRGEDSSSSSVLSTTNVRLNLTQKARFRSPLLSLSLSLIFPLSYYLFKPLKLSLFLHPSVCLSYFLFAEDTLFAHTPSAWPVPTFFYFCSPPLSPSLSSFTLKASLLNNTKTPSTLLTYICTILSLPPLLSLF